MPRRRDERPRVLGPKWVKQKELWRIISIDPRQIDPRRRRRDRFFRTREEASETKRLIEEKFALLEGRTVETAIEAYRVHLQEKGTGSKSYTETVRRLRLFFLDGSANLARITDEKAEALYKAFRARKKKNGEPISVDYHRNALAESKSFLRWCVGQNWIRSNPLDEVEGKGKRSAGKPQYTGEEAHRFLFAALWMAHAGDKGALGVGLLLGLALRQKDVRIRLVRDVDLGATVYRVEKGKTAKSNRPRKIPAIFGGLLRDLTLGRGPLEPLFVASDGGFHTASWLRAAARRVAKRAGVHYIPPHGLKGTAGTLAIEAGALADQVADFLSHVSLSTTERHYLADGAVEMAEQERGLRVIQGGRK